MRILVCALDFPYPARGGGRADIWRRIQAFTRLGHEVMLVNSYDPDSPRMPLPEEIEHTDTVLNARFSLALGRRPLRVLRDVLAIPRRPLHVSFRTPGAPQSVAMRRAVRAFGPDLVWLDGPWFGELALELKEHDGVPIAYRSHNVEHVYLRRQAAAATGMRDKLSWRLACLGLARYELALMHAADTVLDISLDDMAQWRRLGVTKGRWLPPLPELALSAPSTHRVTSDVLFVGGLRTPNNVQGVRWLLTDVVPRLLERRPGLRVGVVGSFPLPELAAELAARPEVDAAFDVPDVTPYQFGAKVLVNPVSVGSGVQLKMLDMLMTDAPIITRSQGLSGLPPECVGQFERADDAETFAEIILRRLDDPGVDRGARASVRRMFDLEAIGDALATVPLEHGPTARDR
ncbi:MAG: glycosyltransferase [Cellulomonadaceae bacterium]